MFHYSLESTTPHPNPQEDKVEISLSLPIVILHNLGPE